MKSILFVCLGNICRSPIAEGIAKKIVKERGLTIQVASAGTGSWHVSEAPCSDSITISRRHDVDISQQRAQQVSPSMLNEYELIIGLDEKNINDLKRMGAKNLHKLGEYGLNNQDVPDPYFFEGSDTLEGFEKVYVMIEVAVGELLKK